MIRYLQIRIKAQAMQFALLVAAVVALLLSAFIALTHVHTFFGMQSTELIALVEATNQGVFTAMKSQTTTLDTLTTASGKMTAKTKVSYQGAWQKAVVVNRIDKKEVARSALFGSTTTPKTPNLYLSDNNAPLIVVGDAHIGGNSYLPESGVRTGTIAGNYYQGSALTYGTNYKSQKALPALAPDWLTYVNGMLNSEVYPESRTEAFSEKTIQHSFLKPEKIVFAPSQIIVTKALQGNIILRSKRAIVVTATAQITDVLLVAPKIIFEKGFKGSVQAIASETIKVADGVTLEYPSSLVVFKKIKAKSKEPTTNGVPEDPAITLGSHVLIGGSIVFLKEKKKEVGYAGVTTDVYIPENAKVLGEVYCQGNVELLGKVAGSLYTEQLLANQYGSIYLNHIYKGKIVANPIENYSGLPFVKGEKTIAKWLY